MSDARASDPNLLEHIQGHFTESLYHRKVVYPTTGEVTNTQQTGIEELRYYDHALSWDTIGGPRYTTDSQPSVRREHSGTVSGVDNLDGETLYPLQGLPPSASPPLYHIAPPSATAQYVTGLSPQAPVSGPLWAEELPGLLYDINASSSELIQQDPRMSEYPLPLPVSALEFNPGAQQSTQSQAGVCRKVGSLTGTNTSIQNRKKEPRYFCPVVGCESKGFTEKHNFNCQS
ncbi:hypothetical protein PM082_004806 [Marasmius tenuissimus]|nr:hypothetical protein PM082_004806 [Marasmius tenuissimus]